jgi:two-component system, NarL family, sensor histidine kinase UhpB
MTAPGRTITVAVEALDHAPAAAPGDDQSSSRAARGGGMSLLWRLFLANGLVLALAVLLLSVTPVTIDAPIALDQFLILLAGLAVMLAIDLFLLRRVLWPLRHLTELMQTIDPDRPGRRLTDVSLREAEVTALADAFNQMLDRLERERRESARVALAAQEGERLRIARELHDEIGQTLTAVALEAERAAQDREEPTAEALERITQHVNQSLDELRRIARRLRPEALDDLGLVNALIALCSRIGTQTDARLERHFEPGLPTLNSDTELVMYRVAQESLTNVVRHARATRAHVSLRADGGKVVLRVQDDGRGMPAELPAKAAGISGMRERALLVGGKLTIRSQPEQGTEVVLEVPIDQAPA